MTFPVGETGSGKSTLVEGVAMAYLGTEAGSPHDPTWHELSHGETFLEVVRTRFVSAGFYVPDEPEAASSFTSTLALVGLLHDLARLDIGDSRYIVSPDTRYIVTEGD